MPNYTPRVDVRDTGQTGTVYQLLLEGTLQVDSTLRRYGYMLVPEQGAAGGFEEDTDLADKEALTSYGASGISDRDLVRTPRVSQGDFTGGQGQATLIDVTRYWDSDLDITSAGALQLRPAWKRVSLGTPTGGGTVTGGKIVPIKTGVAVSFPPNCNTVYFVGSDGSVTASTPPINVGDLDTDGEYVYAMKGDGTSIYRTTTNPISWVKVTDSMHGNALDIWVVKLGTTPGLSGYFLYYLNSAGQVWRVDLAAAFPSNTHTQVSIPGNDALIDLTQFQSGIALLCSDGGGSVGSGGSQMKVNLYFHDGVNTSKMVSLDGYFTNGMCYLLGDLYVSLVPFAAYNGPILARISSGGFEIVAEPGTPGVQVNADSGLHPQASGSRIYWPLRGVASAVSGSNEYIAQYDTQTGVLSHLPPQDTTDPDSLNIPRSFLPIGRSILFPFQPGGANTAGYLQLTRDTSIAGDGHIVFQASGKMITSQVDFGTPTITKQFRRVNCYHGPLPANTSVKVDVFVDQDPSKWTSSLTPTATVTNSTAASTKTSVNLPTATMGLSVYLVLTLATSDGLNTPSIKIVSVEANTLWVLKFKLDCTSKIRTLTGEVDDSNLKGKDRYFFLHTAWEDSIDLKLYAANGVTYTGVIESLKAWEKNPQARSTDIARSDFEAWVDMTFRVTSHD